MVQNKYSLKFTPKAENDLDEIYNYISNKLFANEAADNLTDKIENSIIRLSKFPFSCGYVLNKPLRNRGYHKLIIDNYIVFYLINEIKKQVIIMRILYGASNYQNIL